MEAITLNLSDEAATALREIKVLGGFPSLAECMRHAIGDELYIQRKRRDGWQILIRKRCWGFWRYWQLEWPKNYHAKQI